MFLTRPVAVVLMLMTFFIIGKSVLATGRKSNAVRKTDS